MNYRNPTSLLEPSPLGFIELARPKISPGAKVLARNGKTGVVAIPDGEGWSVFPNGKLSEFREKGMTTMETNYQVFSVHGASFPVAKRFYPPCHSRALISDPDYGRLRSLTLVEAWALLGGTSDTYYRSNGEFREPALLISTTVAVQIYLTGLALGSLIGFPQKRPARAAIFLFYYILFYSVTRNAVC